MTVAAGALRAAAPSHDIGRAALAAGLFWCLAAGTSAQLDLRIPAETSRSNVQCADCGEVRSVREINVGRAPGPDPQQASIGAVVSLPFGGGGKEPMRIGGVGTPEMQARFGDTAYEIMVRMDGGEYRTVQRRDGSGFQIGDRVKFASGQLELMRR